MKHFLIDIQYKVPVEQLAEILPFHRAFLRTGYDKGILLMSGPKNPRIGGVAIGRADSISEIEDFFKDDPYQQNRVATYIFVEFDPVLSQPWLENWIKA
jgi:uncharacterized protein YciI